MWDKLTSSAASADVQWAMDTPGHDDPDHDADSGACFDLATLDRATAGDQALQREVVALFSTQVADKLTTIRNAVLAGDADALRRASHTLLGSCTTLGAVRMAELLATLEQAAGSGAFELAWATCVELAGEADRALQFLTLRGLL